jgi:hypothetical protein
VIAAGAAAYYIHLLQARLRQREEELAECRRRDEQRNAFCRAFGHHLDEMCRCTRCLAERHDYAEVAAGRAAVGRELVNPRADPGALHLDSNFQPDADYGKTQTIYRVMRTFECRRCRHTKETVETETVIDEE